MNYRFKLLLLSISLFVFSSTSAQEKKQTAPMTIAEQGSFAVGGTIKAYPGTYTTPTSPEGQTLHGDHGYVFYQKPVNPRKYPLVFLHRIFQFSKTWETTPDGREGFQNIFLRKGYSTYNFTTPRRGHAGRATVDANIPAVYDEQLWFNRFRLGVYPNYFEGVQFKQDDKTLEQFYRQITPKYRSI